jgi:hypothetical protein
VSLGVDDQALGELAAFLAICPRRRFLVMDSPTGSVGSLGNAGVIRAFSARRCRQARLDVVLLPVGDGLVLARKR